MAKKNKMTGPGVLVIRVDGSEEPYTGPATLEAWYKALNCEMVEEVPVDGTFSMLCDEEGLLVDKPRNERACAIWAKARGVSPSQVRIVGDVLYGPAKSIFVE